MSEREILGYIERKQFTLRYCLAFAGVILFGMFVIAVMGLKLLEESNATKLFATIGALTVLCIFAFCSSIMIAPEKDKDFTIKKIPIYKNGKEFKK